MIIYLFSFPNGKHYVGRTKNSFEQRCTEHKSRVGKTQHPLYYAFEKYGWDNVNKRVIDFAETHEELVLKELTHINKYNSLFNGYNLTINTEIGGDNWEGRRDTEKYLLFIEKMKEINSEGRMHGKYHSEDTKALQKEKAKGRFSLEWFQHRNGIEEGEKLYKARCLSLKNRKYKDMKDPATGQFRKKV
jgi:group I intron endonuclease